MNEADSGQILALRTGETLKRNMDILNERTLENAAQVKSLHRHIDLFHERVDELSEKLARITQPH